MTDERCPYCRKPEAECDCVRDIEGRKIAPAQHADDPNDIYERMRRDIRNPKEEKKHELQGEKRRRLLAHRAARRDGLPTPNESHRKETALASLGAL